MEFESDYEDIICPASQPEPVPEQSLIQQAAAVWENASLENDNDLLHNKTTGAEKAMPIIEIDNPDNGTDNNNKNSCLGMPRLVKREGYDSDSSDDKFHEE